VSNGGDMAGLPVWARVIAVLGFPTVVAVLLLAVFLGWIKSPLTEVLSLQQQQIAIMAQNLQSAQQFRNEERITLEYQNVLLRTLCRNFAKDQTQCEPRYFGYEEKK